MSVFQNINIDIIQSIFQYERTGICMLLRTCRDANNLLKSFNNLHSSELKAVHEYDFTLLMEQGHLDLIFYILDCYSQEDLELHFKDILNGICFCLTEDYCEIHLYLLNRLSDSFIYRNADILIKSITVCEFSTPNLELVKALLDKSVFDYLSNIFLINYNIISALEDLERYDVLYYLLVERGINSNHFLLNHLIYMTSCGKTSDEMFYIIRRIADEHLTKDVFDPRYLARDEWYVPNLINEAYYEAMDSLQNNPNISQEYIAKVESVSNYCDNAISKGYWLMDEDDDHLGSVSRYCLYE